jgi:hypothetical protein
VKKATRHLAALISLSCSPLASGEDDWFDRFEDFLTVDALHGKVRARLSGTLDLEAYSLPNPPPGLIYTDRSSFFNPRLTLFLDAQLGSKVYLFAQGRADRGFDPGYEESRVGIDEYAVRFTPWEDGRFSFQIGRFATMVGNWALRHGSWENPFITAPLPYENLTGMWDSSSADSLETLRAWSGFGDSGYTSSKADLLASRRLRIPLIWGPSYNTGLAAFGQIGKVEYAVEFKNTALSSRVDSWDGTAVQWQHPTVSGRIGYRPSQNWNFGFSGSTGTYLHPDAAASIAPGEGFEDYRQTTLGQDLRFEWHRWQVWAEVFESRFEVPGVGNADSVAYYIETKYKFTPQLFGAFRWGQHLFGTLPDGNGGSEPWGGDISRAELALGYRFTAHSQLKLQYSLEHREVDGGGFANTLAAQFTLRF